MNCPTCGSELLKLPKENLRVCTGKRLHVYLAEDITRQGAHAQPINVPAQAVSALEALRRKAGR